MKSALQIKLTIIIIIILLLKNLHASLKMSSLCTVLSGLRVRLWC